MKVLRIPLALVAFLAPPKAQALTVDFADLSLPAESFWNGPDPDGQIVDGRFGPERVGQFESGGAAFRNTYDLVISNSWRDFAYSNQSIAASSGIANQFVAAGAAGGADGVGDNYAVAFGYLDLQANLVQQFDFDPSNAEHLAKLPTITLPAGGTAVGAKVNNSTFTTEVIATGDGFSKKFGAESGGDPDWFKLTAYGTDSAGDALGVSAEFYLADFRSADPSEDYIVTEWTEWDLSPLAEAAALHFNLTSSDVGLFGMNTPAYFALDDLVLEGAAPAGDFNADGRVDAVDYAAWREGDADSAKLQVWRQSYGIGPPSAAAPTPEPASAGLLLALLFVQRLFRDP